MPRKPVNKFDNKGYITPPIPTPEDFVYFCVPIPNEPQHIENFLGCFQQLTKWTSYKRTEDKRGKAIADIYRDIFLDLTYSDESCLPEVENRDHCQVYDAAEERATFYPTIDATELPLGYVVNPWVPITGPNPLVGLRTGDVITDLLRLPPLPSIWDHLDDIGTILALGYPSISITGLVGRGTVRVYLLSVLLGGRALIVRDNDLFSTSFLDTNIDTVSLPPETYAENIVEYQFDTSGDHRLDIVFVPNVSADIEFLGYGGGFRRVEICGFEENEGEPMACCDETNDKLDELNKTVSAMLELFKGGATINFNVQDLPNDFRVDCSPSDFDKDTDETDEEILADRKTALCLTVARYILATLWRYGKSMNMGAVTKSDLLLLMDLDAPPDFYPQIVPGNNDFVTLQMVSRIAGTGTDAFENVICAMVLGLTGDHNTYSEFKASLVLGDVSIYPDSETHWLTEIIVACNQKRENYNVFARELDTTYGEIVDGLEYECPCEVITPTACTEPLELEFKNGRGLTIELVGTDLYHFTGDPGTGPPYVGGCYVRDALGRCLEVYEPTTGETGLPVGWAGQAVSYHFLIGCCGTENHEGPGGFAGGPAGGTYFTEFYWDCGNTTPVDTYYKVRCKDTSECE